MSTKRVLTALAAIGLLLALGSCEDTIQVAPEGSEIILVASPSNIVTLDGNGDGISNITATVLNGSGIPQKDVSVFFTTNNGNLDSDGAPQETDSNGLARDILRTPRSAQVSARSGPAMEQITVTVGGQQVVGTVFLSAETTLECQSPCTVKFRATVNSTNNTVMAGVVVTVTYTSGDWEVDPPTELVTGTNGSVTFDVVGITESTGVIANAGGISSQTRMVTITPST